ncbi:hypothetical protein CLOBOL_00501 [Enterocloster bolteae ATCC BAA-613]|uniref:Uncharacterized protein n=1 Tax=Enterocloster bolteae (strain ATCC BAA-613 / DSM 15670 / CCUG 46953 / JCM 12243 / WAL 16351) TaxID=411902 RepID=A8RHT6_ENTBW|nr:hypothetical protein CLOBOL_00501 [Enterocloster bolteae ATCC BAA-613]
MRLKKQYKILRNVSSRESHWAPGLYEKENRTSGSPSIMLSSCRGAER